MRRPRAPPLPSRAPSRDPRAPAARASRGSSRGRRPAAPTRRPPGLPARPRRARSPAVPLLSPPRGVLAGGGEEAGCAHVRDREAGGDDGALTRLLGRVAEEDTREKASRKRVPGARRVAHDVGSGRPVDRSLSRHVPQTPAASAALPEDVLRPLPDQLLEVRLPDLVLVLAHEEDVDEGEER